MSLAFTAIGADLLDITGKHNIDHENYLQEIDSVFELTEEQQQQLFSSQQVSQYIRSQYHSMHETIWHHGYTPDSSFPDR